jgi:hypothetical protein
LAGDALASIGAILNRMIGGGQIGHNYQINIVVLGIEACVRAWSSLSPNV